MSIIKPAAIGKCTIPSNQVRLRWPASRMRRHIRKSSDQYSSKQTLRNHKMRYLVLIYRYKRSYSAMAPDLPGCIAAARTIDGVRKLMAEAMWLHLDAMRKSGDKIPKPRKRVQLDADEFEDDEIC